MTMRAASPADPIDRTQEPVEIFSAFVADEPTRRIVRQAAEMRGWPSSDIVVGGLAAAVRTLGAAPPSRLVLLDVTGHETSAETMRTIVDLHRQGAMVLILGGVNDVALFRCFLEAGAVDYLTRPIDADVLGQALERAWHHPVPVAEREPRLGRCIAFAGVRGGVGASTVAAGFAWITAETMHRRTLIVDLDLHFGTQALLLNQDPGRGLVDALDDPRRVDAVFLERAVASPAPRLHLLAGECPMGEPASPDGEAVGHLIETVRAAYDVAVLDLPRTLLAQDPGLAVPLTDLVLVADRSIPAVREINRLARHVRAVAADLPIHVLINRAGSGRGEAIPHKAFAKALDLPVVAVVPADPVAAAEGQTAGRPLSAVAPRGAAAKALGTFAATLFGPPHRRRLFDRLLRR